MELYGRFPLNKKAYYQSIYEPEYVKTNKMICVPSEDSDHHRHPPSPIRVFAVCFMVSQTLSTQTAKSSQTRRMPRLNLVFAWHTGHFVGFLEWMDGILWLLHATAVTSNPQKYRQILAYPQKYLPISSYQKKKKQKKKKQTKKHQDFNTTEIEHKEMPLNC